MERIYLDHASTTPLDSRVLETMLPYFTKVYGNADSPHQTGRRAMSGVDDARDTLARLINAKQSEIYFTSGGTESGNWAMLGGARAKRKENRTRVIVSAIEHHAVLSSAQRLEQDGFEVVYLPVNDGGRVEPNELKALVNERTALVAVMSANNETGVLQPIEECCEIAHEKGALFFTDATQLAPYMPIDTKKWNADLIAFSAHKFYGPKGAGVLYIKSGTKAEKLISGGEQERGMRGGTLNVPSIVGLAKAYELNYAQMEQNGEKLCRLSKLLMQELAPIQGITRNGDSENALPSILNLRVEGVENTALLYNMDLQGVSIAVGSACSSASVKPSHVLTAMGLSEKAVKESVRLSLGKDNTEEEIIRVARIMREVVERLKKK